VAGREGIFRRVAQNGVAEGFLFFTRERVESGGATGRSGGVGSKVALFGPHRLDAASHELSQAHERVVGERQGEGVVGGGRMVQTPVVEQEQASFGLEGKVGGLHDTIRVEGGEV